MSGEALYERYKDALRRGHVASLRGRLEEALTAYAEAAAIAPERATPHTSAGAALMRRKRPADALRHYGAAIRLAPRDESALLGRAQTLAALERRSEAGDAYDAVAEVLAANGKLADAVDAARKGLELAEGRERRRTLERLVSRLRASDPGDQGRIALEKAFGILEGRAVDGRSRAGSGTGITKAGASRVTHVRVPPIEPKPPAAKAPPPLAGATATGPDVVEAPAPEVIEPAAAAVAEPVPVEPAPAQPVEVAPAAAELAAPVVAEAPAEVAETAPPVETAAPETQPGEAPEPVPETVPEPVIVPMRAVLDRDLPAGLDLAALAVTVDASFERGSAGAGLDQVLDLAAGYRGELLIEAALDTCYRALSVAPDDLALHLALVELYDVRGWTTLAEEKLDLLDRLSEFDDGGLAAARVGAARAARR